MSLGLSDPKLTFFTSLPLHLGKHDTNIEKKNPRYFHGDALLFAKIGV